MTKEIGKNVSFKNNMIPFLIYNANYAHSSVYVISMGQKLCNYSIKYTRSADTGTQNRRLLHKHC